MQNEITKAIPLLDNKGHITEEGWARRPLWQYGRKDIKASKLAIKEWDYYALINQEKGYAVTATLSDLGYAAVFAISYSDLTKKDFAQKDAITLFPRGKLGLSPTSTEDSQVAWSNEDLRFACIKRGEKRHLMFACPNLVLPDGRVGLDVNVTLTQRVEMESINIATSWKEKRKAFYLNEKVNCMPVEGVIRRGLEKEHLLLGETWAVLDWGRGRWTYQNRWYWSSASGLLENVPFGFNLGYGFSDRTSASENALFYDGVIHKLEEVTFHIPKDGYLLPWKVTSSDNRLKLDFIPAVDRSSHTNFLLIQSKQHQVFGYFSGTVILDDKTELTLSRFPGFAEDVYNRW